MLSEKFIEIVEQTPAEVRESLSSNVRSQLYFTLESYISESRQRVVREDWEHKLMQLNELFTKEKILLLKEEMLLAETEGREEDASAKLKEIDVLKKRLPT